MIAISERLSGQLAATLHLDESHPGDLAGQLKFNSSPLRRW